MLKEFQGKVYLAVGRTDLRRGIDGLAAIVQQQFELNPFTETLFLFCGRRKHRKNVHFYCFRVCPNPICRRRAEG